jgi:undecaprenyl-diphosphatase
VRNPLLALILGASVVFSSAAEPAAPGASLPGAAPGAPAAELRVSDAIILGVIEGVTEFLPISSTGHLIIASRALGLDSTRPLPGPDGKPLWYKKPKGDQPGEPLTLKLAADTYIVIIQFGAIAAVALLYWNQLLSMLYGLLGRDPAGRRLLINVMIAFVPAAGIGFLASKWIEQHLFSVGTVIFAQVAGALLMFYAESWYRKKVKAGQAAASVELTPKGALNIGLLQCIAMCPGTSRSMMTIVGGYFAGLDPRRAAEFSFILGFVTLTAASIYKSLKGGAAMIQVFGWPNIVLGAIVAAVTAAICVRFLVHWLTRHGLGVFAWYRLTLAAALAAYFYL